MVLDTPSLSLHQELKPNEKGCLSLSHDTLAAACNNCSSTAEQSHEHQVNFKVIKLSSQ